MRPWSPSTAALGCLLLAALGCSHRLHLDSRGELTGTKVWAEPAGDRITVVVSLPHPEGAPSPRVASLDEPFDFTRSEVDGATEIRFPVARERLGAKQTVRLSVTYDGAPSTLVLEGPIRTLGQAVANTLFWTVISGR
jgi:hypothetical protein